MRKHIPKVAETDLEIQRCFDVKSELRTQLKRDEFLKGTTRSQAHKFYLNQGFTIAASGPNWSLSKPQLRYYCDMVV